MEKMKRFIDCYIPTETCNLRCHYCYITQERKFNNKLAKLNYSPEQTRKALSVERLGGKCMFNFCAGGETLLAEEIIDVVMELLKEGHYVMIVTNGTLSNRFKQIAKFPKELLNHLFFKFSFHYLELKRLNMLDIFEKNVALMKSVGASITLEITPSDELIPHIEEVCEYSKEKFGALPHITVARYNSGDKNILTKFALEEYKKIWKKFDSKLFEFKMSTFGVKRREFCYAGDWTLNLNIVTGEYKQCYGGKVLGNIYENVETKLKFEAIGCNCQEPHCYNSHAFLTFGAIPELNLITYDELRNRKCTDGTEWLTPDMKEFMSSKLANSNEEYSFRQKKKINYNNRKNAIKSKLKNKIRRIFK